MTHESGDKEFANAHVAAFWSGISRSLTRFEQVLDGRSVEELNWRPPAAEANTLYELATHSLGHLRQGILEVLGGQSYPRDRDSEFAAVATAANVPIPEWAPAREAMHQVLATLPGEALDTVYSPVNREPLTGLELLILMSRHTAEHVGHAELTRDMVVAMAGTNPDAL